MQGYFLPTLKSKKLPDLTCENVAGCVEGVAPGEANYALTVARILPPS
jgi:hypothetical protein